MPCGAVAVTCRLDVVGDEDDRRRLLHDLLAVMYVSEPSDLISECKLDARDSDGKWDSAARWRLPPRSALCQ